MKFNINLLLISILSVCCLFMACVSQKMPTEVSVKRGEYLVKDSNCGYCHTPLTESNGEIIPDNSRMFSGHPEYAELPEIPDVSIESEEWIEFLTTLDSTVWAGEWGITFSANITPDKETGIGLWGAGTFIQTMRQGRHKGIGRYIKPPMPWKDYSKLSDDDLNSIFQYLSTLKPVRNRVPAPITLKK